MCPLDIYSFQIRAPIGLPGTETGKKQSDSGSQADDGGFRYPFEALERVHQTCQQPYSVTSLISLVPVDEETHPVNRARWVKFAILMYRYDIEVGHCLLDSYMPEEAVLNLATTTTTTTNTHSIEDFLPWSDLEVANFGSIYLTRTGTVVYLGYPGPYMLVDEEELKTCRLILVEFKSNGAVEDSMLIRPFNMRWPHLNVSVHMKGLDEIRHCPGGYRYQNTP